MFLFLVLMMKILFAEARVFCQDINAKSWTPLGFACPITCSAIRIAVGKLKTADYEHLLQENVRYHYNLNISETDLNNILQNLDKDTFSRRLNSFERNHIKLYQTYHRLLTNENFERALKKEAGKMTADINKTCVKMASKDLFKKIVNLKCTRRLNKRPEVVRKFRDFINVFADPMYSFDEDMVRVILHKLQGKLNKDVINYKKIIEYMRQALKYHKMKCHAIEDMIIKLQSTNCLKLYNPGCYCRTGYVERENECVKPEDCLFNPQLTEYLERIILL